MLASATRSDQLLHGTRETALLLVSITHRNFTHFNPDSYITGSGQLHYVGDDDTSPRCVLDLARDTRYSVSRLVHTYILSPISGGLLLLATDIETVRYIKCAALSAVSILLRFQRDVYDDTSPKCVLELRPAFTTRDTRYFVSRRAHAYVTYDTSCTWGPRYLGGSNYSLDMGTV